LQTPWPSSRCVYRHCTTWGEGEGVGSAWGRRKRTELYIACLHDVACLCEDRVSRRKRMGHSATGHQSLCLGHKKHTILHLHSLASQAPSTPPDTQSLMLTSKSPCTHM
jgi:hypothetical protein